MFVEGRGQPCVIPKTSLTLFVCLFLRQRLYVMLCGRREALRRCQRQGLFQMLEIPSGTL